MDLLNAARAVQPNAYAPYSKFNVGAAVQTKDGAVYVGVNVENAAYPEGTCAEAAAIAAMCTAGEREIVEVAVIADCEDPVPPCGGCRQKLSEFAGRDVKVTLGTLAGKTLETTVGGLLPGNFDASFMET